MTVYFLDSTGTMPINHLALNFMAIEMGQYWRLVTFLFIPLSTSVFFLFFELMILVMIGDALESEWGSFKLTVYYFCGAAATIVAGYLYPSGLFGSYYLNLSLFLAFATLFPDFEILVFFILPVKVKWLGLISAAGIAWTLLVGILPLKILAGLSVANYFLFFWQDWYAYFAEGGRRLAHQRRFAGHALAPEAQTPRNVCSVCGKTDLSHPDVEFRYCTCPRCGEQGTAFCKEHLAEHKALTTSEPASDKA